MYNLDRELKTYQGSLLSEKAYIISSYDIEKGEKYKSIKKLRNNRIVNHSYNKKNLELIETKKINIINGFGVTLGDSIIGLNVCLYLKEKNKKIKINIARPCTTPNSIESLYFHAKKIGIFDSAALMPYPLSECSDYDFNIDMGNQLYREDFQSLEMHDYFYVHMGIASENVPHTFKTNNWLKRLSNETKYHENYILFCPNASTKVREIPLEYHAKIIEQLHKLYKLPVLGFSPTSAASYTNISDRITDTISYINIIRNASFVYTADSSAVHIAAGFDIPCHCIFTSINPDLRIRYYQKCTGSFIGDNITQGIHFTEDQEIINHAKEKYRIFFKTNIF